MISAFGIDHGVISKANVKFGEYGWSSKEGRKRTTKEIKADSRVKAGHGNAGRIGAHSSIGAGLGAVGGGLVGSEAGGKGAAIGAGVGAASMGALGALGGKAENIERSAQRNVGHAVKRGDIRRVKSGERTSAWTNTIMKD